MDELLLKWFYSARDEKIPVSREMLFLKLKKSPESMAMAMLISQT